jgi:hypothetical protein
MPAMKDVSDLMDVLAHVLCTSRAIKEKLVANIDSEETDTLLPIALVVTERGIFPTPYDSSDVDTLKRIQYIVSANNAWSVFIVEDCTLYMVVTAKDDVADKKADAIRVKIDSTCGQYMCILPYTRVGTKLRWAEPFVQAIEEPETSPFNFSKFVPDAIPNAPIPNTDLN